MRIHILLLVTGWATAFGFTFTAFLHFPRVFFLPLFPTFTAFVILRRLRIRAVLREVRVIPTAFYSSTNFLLLYFWCPSPLLLWAWRTTTSRVSFAEHLIGSNSWFQEVYKPQDFVQVKVCPYPKLAEKTLTNLAKGRDGRIAFVTEKTCALPSLVGTITETV